MLRTVENFWEYKMKTLLTFILILSSPVTSVVFLILCINKTGDEAWAVFEAVVTKFLED